MLFKLTPLTKVQHTQQQQVSTFGFGYPQQQPQFTTASTKQDFKLQANIKMVKLIRFN